MKHSLHLLLALMIFASCDAQVNTHTANKPHAVIGTRKLPKARNAFTDASVGAAVQDNAGNFWFCSNGEGVFFYNGNTFTNYREQDGFDNLYIYSLLHDRDNNIWVGTRTGLYKYNKKGFTHVPITVTNDHSFNSLSSFKDNSSPNAVWAMMQDKSGKIWLGTDNGVYCYDGNSFTRFLDDNNIINRDSLHLKSIFSFLEDKKGNMWFGSCIGEGLIRFDGSVLQRVSPKGYARTQSLVEDKNGNIWFGSVGKGMCQYNGSVITTNFFKEKSTYDLMYLILKDKQDHLWFCDPSNNRSLGYYDGKVTNLSDSDLPDKKMYPLLQDRQGNTWFAAEGMRLYKWDGKAYTSLSE